jgi:mono/diheme cytochrome c family protein
MSARAAEAPVTDAAVTYEGSVRPILKTHCFGCHGEGKELKGGLDLRLRRLMVQGGDSGPAIEPGKPEESLLLDRVLLEEMPPGDDALSAPEVAVVEQWIAAGAPTARPEPEDLGDGSYITEEERGFWSFQPIQHHDVPDVKEPDRVRTPIDAFLLARMQADELAFAADADKRALIRRATFDLLGLPPSPEEVELFLADESADAYARLLDRLLASPHYGERWGRHWLDVAGYADSEGYTDDDVERPHAFRYRDYVIRSFNADKPFDQFITEQLAGDEMVGPPYENLRPGDVEKLAATGFLRMAPDGTGESGVDMALASNAVVADTIKIVSSSLLGITVGCAQCHNHRYDPIPQSDYYRMRAIFEPALDWKNWRAPAARRVSLYTDEDRARAAEIEAEAAQVDAERDAKQQESIRQTFERQLAKVVAERRDEVRAAYETPAGERSPEHKRLLEEFPDVNVSAGSLYLYDSKAADDLKQIAARADAIRATKPVEGFVRALTEVSGQVPETHLFDRGDHEQPKEKLLPGGLSVLASLGLAAIPENDPALPSTGRRLALARQWTDPRHPLVSRVLVNRFWMHHFGRGIVGTPGDFGALGDRPTHPELLDWLAADFVAGGWRLKRLHKQIMLSTAYRQASQRSPHFPLRRLEAEVIRDAILSASGKLNVTMFGPPVPVMADTVGQFVIGIENLNAGRPGDELPMHGEEFRRSVYVQVRRSRPLAVLSTFDAPAMDPNCEARASSTVAPQALMLMNSPFVAAYSQYLADRVVREVGAERQAQVRRAWLLAFGREPTDDEAEEADAFLDLQTASLASKAAIGSATDEDAKADEATRPERAALATLCQALLSSNEFLYVD